MKKVIESSIRCPTQNVFGSYMPNFPVKTFSHLQGHLVNSAWVRAGVFNPSVAKPGHKKKTGDWTYGVAGGTAKCVVDTHGSTRMIYLL